MYLNLFFFVGPEMSVCSVFSLSFVYMHICVCLYIYVLFYIHTHIYMHTHLHTYTYACVYVYFTLYIQPKLEIKMHGLFSKWKNFQLKLSLINLFSLGLG